MCLVCSDLHEGVIVLFFKLSLLFKVGGYHKHVEQLAGVVREQNQETKNLHGTERHTEDEQIDTELPHIRYEREFLQLTGLVVSERLEFELLSQNSECSVGDKKPPGDP